MLTLLRKVRQSLVETGATRRYLFYAIGEIALVVMGILIALQINNWNEERKEQALQKEYLKGIKQDLEADIPFIEKRISRLVQRISTLHEIDSTYIPASQTEPYDVSLDSIDLHYVFRRGPSFRLTFGSYNALISNASIGLITNQELLQSIQELYNVRYPGSLSVYDDLKKREDHIGWKYAYELKHSDIQSFFIDNPRKKEALADFNFYYKKLELYCSVLSNDQEFMLQIIDDLSTEITRLNKKISN